MVARGPELVLASASIVLTCLAVLGFELVSRWIDPTYLQRFPGSASFDGLHRYSEVYGWELRPGAREDDRGQRVTVNDAGYRGAEVPRERQPGGLRALMLGDSITFGTYVTDGQAFADLMHRPEAGTEVVNLAVQGFGLDQSLTRFEREGRAFEPDVVVLNVCLANDFADTMLPVFLYDGRHPKPYYRLEQGQLIRHDAHLRLGFGERLGRFLGERSHAYNRVSRALGRGAPADTSASVEHWTFRKNQALRPPGAALDLGLRVVAELRRQVEATGAAFVVVLHPDRPSFARATIWRDAFAESRLLQGATVVDLAREYGTRGLAYGDLTLDKAGHLSPYGHRQAAAILGPVVTHAARAASSPPAAPRPPGV